MQEEVIRRSSVKKITKTVLALKAARISLGLNRREAAERCSCSIRALEQLENGRCNFTEDRIKGFVEKMGMSWAEFSKLNDSPEKVLAQIDAYNLEQTMSRKPRRNVYKVVTDLTPVIFYNDKGELEFKDMRFSLCPSWSKEFPCKFTTYNARMERPRVAKRSEISPLLDSSFSKTDADVKSRVLGSEPPALQTDSEFIFEIPTWKDSFNKGRTCLVPMTTATESSYFGLSAGNIIGFSQKSDEVFYVAGLWNEWINKSTG